MYSRTVYEILKIYNILSCGNADKAKYKETLLYKSVTEDTEPLIAILNGEPLSKVIRMKSPIDLSKKFGFFEGNRKVYELFGHALRRVVDTYGSEFSFNEEDMFIHDDEKIEERDYQTITTFFNLRIGTKYTKDQFTQEISDRDIYLHFYAEKYRSFADMIKEAFELKKIAHKIHTMDKEFKDMQEKLNAVNEELKESKTKLIQTESQLKEVSKVMKTNLDTFRNDLEHKYSIY